QAGKEGNAQDEARYAEERPKREKGDEPQTSCRHRSLRGSQERSEGSKEEVAMLAGSVTTRTRFILASAHKRQLVIGRPEERPPFLAVLSLLSCPSGASPATF